MYNYTIDQWLLFFYIYCFVGWCIESSYVSIKKRRFVNRGFLFGPFIPIYGSGAMVMLIASYPVKDNLFLTFLAGCIGATILEYITGVCMEAVFKVRYWDYSDVPFNFQGHICLGTTIAWGALTILLVRFIHHPVEGFILSLSREVTSLVTIILTSGLAVDLALSVRNALDLRNFLDRMTNSKKSLTQLQQRLDNAFVTLDNAASDMKLELSQKFETCRNWISSHKGSQELRTEELLDNIFNQLSALKSLVRLNTEKLNQKFDDFLDELEEIKATYTIEKEKKQVHQARVDKVWKKTVLKNPSISSRKFKDAMSELKENIKDRTEKK